MTFEEKLKKAADSAKNNRDFTRQETKVNNSDDFVSKLNTAAENAKQAKKAEATFKSTLDKYRTERSDYFKTKSGWKSENSPKNEVRIDAYTSYDGTKPTSKDDVIAAGNELAEKVRNGTATDDDYRKYVNAEALYGEGLYNGFQSRIEAAPKYHVAPVVDSWDKTGISETELWKTEDEYKKDASALTSEMQSAYGKYAKGEMSDADINAFADKFQRFAAKEKAYFSDRYQQTGTLATADALKLRRDAKKDAHDATTKRLNEITNQLGSNDVIKNAGSMGELYAEKEQLEKSDDIAGYNDLQDKYYRALQFEAEKDVADKYDGYKAEYGKNGVDYANKSGSFDKVDGVTTEKVSYKGASDFLKKYTDTYKTSIDSNIRELNEYGTDEQKDIFLQLFTEKGYKDALNYAKDIHPLISKQAAKIQGEKYEDSNALERFGMGVGAVFEGGIGDIGQSVTGLVKAVNRDTSYTHRNTAQQKADAVIEAEKNPVADLLMQAGRSAVANSPSIIVGVATGGSSLASTAVLFASAAGSAYVDAVNKGNGYYASLGYGITNGVLEAATEKLFDVPGFYGGSKVDDAFKGMISKSVSKLSMGTKGKTALNFLGYMAANGFGEAVEEGIMAAVEPTLGNIFLSEKNESFTAEHFAEIGYAALLGTTSSFLMPLSYVSTYADAKGDTAVWSVLNGEKVTDMQIEDIVNSRSSREIFEKAMGFELSDNKDVAKAQVTAVANSIRATSETIKGADVSSVVENIDVSSVAEYTEAISDYITEPDAEYVANETEAVAEMTEIANEELAREAANKEDTTPTEAIENAASEAVEETVSDLMDGVSTETASINEGVEADEGLVDYGVSDRQAALERAVDGDSEIARLTERYENGEISEAEYDEAVARRVAEIERSISEGDGDVSEADSAPVADVVTENGGTSIMSKDEFDVVRNNSYSVTRNSAKDIKANPIFGKVSASDIRAFRAVGKALGVDVKAFDGETLGLTGTDGAYDPKTRTIYLNVTSPMKAISSAFRHEVIHYLKASSPKAYGEFAAFVIDKYKEQYSDEDYNAWLDAKREEYAAMGTTLTRDDAEEEFLAQFGMDMLQQKAIARDFVRHHHKAAVRIFEAIRERINEIRRFFGWKEVPSDVYAAIRYMAEDSSGQVQVSGNSYTRSHLQGSKELLPSELNIDALNAADEALLNAFAEVADINKRVQAKLKNAPADVMNDDVKRAELVNRLWAEETGVESDGEVRFNGESDSKFSLSSMGSAFFGNEKITASEVEQMLEDGSYKNYEGYRNYVNDCINVFRQSHPNMTAEDAVQIENSIEGIMRVAVAAKKAGYDIFDDGRKRNIKDSKKRLLFSSLEPNSDYITSGDIATICDKRINFSEIYEDIVRLEESRNVPKDERFFNNVDNYFIIHKIMAEKGLTVPCEECYVESMRKNLAPMAKAFIELITETDVNNKENAQLYNQDGKNSGELKKNNAKIREKVRNTIGDYGLSVDGITIETLTTAEGLASLKLQAPLIYETFNSFYGQSKPKMPREATPFRPGELIALLTDNNNKINKKTLDKIKSTGGFRLQSYSDFQIKNFVDVLQTIFEASMLGLNGHAYTKVPAFLEATDGTNLKRNISIFMYEDGGKWVLDKKNSFPMELDDIYALVASDKTGNTSIIAVSQNAEMSAWIMANDLVGYGIPFHKSGLKMEVVRARVVKTEDGREVLGYANEKDHTAQQSEVYKKTLSEKKKENTKVKNPIDIYKFWDFDNKDNLPKNKLIEKNLKAYIDECEKRNYRPKFREYVMDNDAVLENVLTYAKEMGFVSEDATIDDISFKYGEYTIPYGYYKFLGDFGMFTTEGEASPIKPLSLVDYDFDKAVSFFNDSAKLRENELLQQFENGKVRDEYRQMIKDGKLTVEQLNEIVKEKRDEVVKAVVDGSKVMFSKSAVDSDNVGYHAGDLGKAESLGSQSKDRSTGHFGRGTYFVGDLEKIKHYNRRDGVDAPKHAVDFSDYNLYKVRSDYDGNKLHDSLRVIDGGIKEDWINAAANRQFRLHSPMDAYKYAEEKYGEDHYSDEARIYGLTELAKKANIDIQTAEEFSKKSGYDLSDEYFESAYIDYLDETIDEELEAMNKEYGEFSDAYDWLELRFGADNVKQAMWKALQYQKANPGNTMDAYKKDTLATVFMKALGYEGVDTRGTSLDNTTYGSVIYDIKKDTVKFSKSPITPAENAEYLELAKNPEQNEAKLSEMVEKAAKESGRTLKVYHGTPRFGFTKLDTRKSDDRISVFATSSLDLATTYSGVENERQINTATKKDVYTEEDVNRVEKAIEAFVEKANSYAQTEVANLNDAPFRKYLKQVKIGKNETAYQLKNMSKLESDMELFIEPILSDVGLTLARKGDSNKNSKNDELRKLSDKILNELTTSFAGNYGFYANVDNLYEIDGNGARWSTIPFDKIPGQDTAMTREIAAWAKKNGYAGVWFKNINDPGGRTDSPGATDVYAFFNPKTQLKSADPVTYDNKGNVIPLAERFNDKKNDIRWSKSSPDSSDTAYIPKGEKPARDIDDAAKLKEKVNELEERIKLERKVTHRTILNRNQLDAFAGRILKQADSDYDRNTLVDNLQEIYSYLTTEGATVDSVFEKFRSLAEAVLGWKRQRTETDYEYKNIWDDIRGTHVRFTESQKQEIKYKYGMTAQQRFVGKIVSDNNAPGLDVWWQQWTDEYPHIFRKVLSEGDMAVKLYEICEMLKEKSEVPIEYADYELEDMAVNLAMAMYSGLSDVSPIKTAADIYDKKLTDIKAERDEAKSAAKNATASLTTLAKRNAVLNKRLADAKNQLKLTKAYSPEPGEIDALAERIASDYNNGDNVKGVKTALTGIYRLWNEGKVTGDEYKIKQANREIASLAQDIMFGEDANVPSTEDNNKAISQFADMLSTEIAFVSEAEPTFADKAKSQLEYEREMAEIDKKEAVAKERLKAEQKAFEKAEKAKDKAERQKYVEFWNKELDKIDNQKAKSIEKAKAEVDRLHQIASRKSALQDMRSTWSATKEQINEIADGLISFYNKDAKKSKVASLVEKIYKARSFAQKDSNVRDVHLKNMNNYIDELTSVLSVRSGDSASIKSEIDNILHEIGRDSLTSFDKASMRGEAITAEINALRNARNAENAQETDARINELRKEYAEVKASVASDGIKNIIENTVKWRGKSVESLINTAVRLERRLQKDIAKQKIDDIRRRGTESKERQRLLKLMQRLKRVKTKPELMAAISEIIGDYDTVAVNITGRKIEELGTIQDEFLAEQKRLIVEGEAPKIMTQALKDKLARLDNKKIGDMSIEEVRSLTEALLEIETRVKAEKKLLNDEFKQTTKEAGRQIIKELNHEKAKGVDANLAEKKKSTDDNHKGKKNNGKKEKKNNGKFDHLRARTFFLNLCGYNENSTLYKLFDAILEGRRNTLLYKQAQDNRLSPWTKDKKYMETIIGEKAEGIDIGGGVKVNKASLIALYLHSMNDDNMRHIEHGGIEIPDFNLMKKGEIKEAYEQSKIDRVFLTKSEIYALCQKHLNEKDKNLANAIRVYFNEVSKKALNEVSLKVYGYEKFNVENYFPIRVDKNFLNSDGTDIFDGEGNINILESGFAQERQKGAITPMLLVDALTVFDRSVNDHALYANLAIPLRDMKAAFGVSVVSKPNDGKYRVETSVWATLKENYGSDAETYIKDFWQNLQGKTVKELGDKRFNGAIGRLATSALYLNEQSALKQFTAYPVALAVLDTKSLSKALKDIGKIDEAKLEKYNRYTPWLVHRSEGLSDATIADLRQGKKNYKWANWLQYTDVLTSKKLLKACEYYVKDNYKDIKPDTDAFYKKVAEKFNEVIEQTQQNNDVVSKTRRLNNQSVATRMFTVFKSQSYQQLNMYIEAQGRVEAKKLAYKNNKDSDAAKEAFDDAKLKRTRTVAGIQLSVAMNIAISLAMLLLRGRWDELDKDKDGEVEMLEVLGNVLSRYFDEQSSMFLFGDVVSYAKDWFVNGTPFTPSENPVIEQFTNVIDKSMKLVGEVEQWIRDGKFNGYELFSAVKGLSVETLKSIGVPAGNAYNLLTTSAYGSSFLLTGGSNDFAQIIRHTIKGDLISKSGKADNYTINKDVKLALFRLFNAKDREVEFERATGILKFTGATDADIYKAIANGYSITLSDNDVNKIEYLKSHLDDKRGLTYYFDVKKLAKSIDVNDNINQEEAEKAIDMLAKKHPDISNDVKAILWQLFNKSWKAEGNPYSKKIGVKCKSEMGWDK